MVSVTQLRLCKIGEKKALLKKYEVTNLEVPEVARCERSVCYRVKEQIQSPCRTRHVRVGEGDNEIELDDLEKKWGNIKEIYKNLPKRYLVLRRGRSRAG